MRAAKALGRKFLVGVDEVGRGPLAGPVVTAAVLIHVDDVLPDGIDDSKALTPHQRAALVEPLQSAVKAHHVVEASAEQIDSHGILVATLAAMREAVLHVLQGVNVEEALVVVDGTEVIASLGNVLQKPLIGGDAGCRAVGAASILAKEHRDAGMVKLDAVHPAYGFARHKGYAAAEHLSALRQHGPCEHHRKSFEPIRSFLATGAWPWTEDSTTASQPLDDG